MNRLIIILGAVMSLLPVACTDSDINLDGEVTAQAPRGLKAALDQTGTRSQTSWNFDTVETGNLPEGWKAEVTNPRGEAAQWSVQQDASAPSGDRVLSLTDTRGARGSTFNLVWTDEARIQNGTIEVKVKARTGREDQGGGTIWRVQDKDNYYVARWNPLENNFRVYYVRDGNRDMLKSANVTASADTWHTIQIRYDGNHIEALLDGEKLFETTDKTFENAGGVGVWTKADAASSFDDLVVSSSEGQ